MARLRIGSRGSQLALWQANHIAAVLRARGFDLGLLFGLQWHGEDTLTAAPRRGKRDSATALSLNEKCLY